jgi:hypothetical protein
MKLTVDLGGLENLRRKMGAKERLWVSDEILLNIRNIQEKLKEGIITDLEDISSSNGGLLSHEGQQIAVYIKDHTNKYSHKGDVLQNADYRNKLHVFDCRTLEQMRKQGKIDKYVKTTNLHKFEIDIKVGGKIEVRKVDLQVCQNCLKALKYKGYDGGRTKVWSSFNLEEFFAEFSTFFAITPKFNDFASPSYQYTKNWSQISLKTRERYSWTCAKCSVLLDKLEHRKYLHAHHEDSIKSNNSKKNLTALCLLCHAKEPNHQHMIVPEEAKRIIQELRLK